MKVVSTALPLLLATAAASAQSGGVVSVRVLDVGDASPVPAAEVGLLGTEFRGRADSLGRVRLAGVAAGAYEIFARRVGYKPVSARIVVQDGDSVDVALAMKVISVALPGMKVTETIAQLHLREFEERLRNHIGGSFITDSVIRKHEADGIEVLLSARVPGVRATRSPSGSVNVYSTRGGPCSVQVFVDGTRILDGDAATLPLFDLAGIEYYSTGFVPVQYRIPPPIPEKGKRQSTGAACGALLLWTRP